MVKNAIRTIWKKLHNILTIWALASLAWGTAMYLTGTFLPSTEWTWVTPKLAQIMSIIGFVLFALTVVLVIIGITKSNEVSPSFKLLIGVRKDIWGLYKQQQIRIKDAGEKGLTRQKLNEILKSVRIRLRARVEIIYSPLNDEETQRVIQRTNEKLGVKDGLSKKALVQLMNLGIVLDQHKVGVSSLIENDKEYDNINNKLGIDRLEVKKNKEIKKLKDLAYTLNTIMLSILYFQPIITEISPELKNIPCGLMKEALDEEMQKQIEIF